MNIQDIDFEAFLKKYSLEYDDKIISHLVSILNNEIAQPKDACFFCENIIKGRCEELEHIISKEYSWSYRYLDYLVKQSDMTKVGSSAIIMAYHYTKFIIKERWIIAEKILLDDRNAYWNYNYARDIIKGPWKEAESIILNSVYAHDYTKSTKASKMSLPHLPSHLR